MICFEVVIGLLVLSEFVLLSFLPLILIFVPKSEDGIKKKYRKIKRCHNVQYGYDAVVSLWSNKLSEREGL